MAKKEIPVDGFDPDEFLSKKKGKVVDVEGFDPDAFLLGEPQQAEKVAQEPSNQFLDDLAAPVRAISNNPLESAEAAARGVQRTVTDIIPQGQENLEALSTFPIVRGAELAAKGALKSGIGPAVGGLLGRFGVRNEFQGTSASDQTAPLTSLRNVFDQRVDRTKMLEEKAPGIERGTELGLIAGQLAPLVKLAVQGTRYGIAKATSKLAQRKADKLSAELLKLDQGPVYDVLMKNPEKVREVMQKGNFGSDDLALAIGDKLEEVSTKLAGDVSKHRAAVLKDTTTRIPINESNAQAINELKDAVTLQGSDLLPPRVSKQVELLENVLSQKSLSKSDTMKSIDLIDSIVDYGAAGGDGSNFINASNATLKGIRKNLKDTIRAGNDDWVKADKAFSDFKSNSRLLKNRLSSDTRETFVKNLLNDGKGSLRGRLAESIDAGSDAASKPSTQFFEEIAARRAARGLKSVELKLTDPIADNIDRIIKNYEEKGKLIGQGAGAFVGAGGDVASLFKGGFSGSVPSVVLGGIAGGGVGKQLGRKAGQIASNPIRVLNNAQKAKDLSQQAKTLAKDLVPIAEKLGTDGVNMLLTKIGASRAAQELVRFSMEKPKSLIESTPGDK